uniref:Uncharacterized protein n=1 Tax=Lactuca sativa TaxID=4236 RepID=A0A9R1UY31_LACSA|nr:hypothetical protein LSAT_V11C700364410 [Lactuca sativa]
MSSSSSELHNTVTIYRFDENPPCLCCNKLISKQREAWKPNNPTRQFYNCAKSMTHLYQNTIRIPCTRNMKLRIDDLLTMIAQVTVLKKKVEKHKYLRQAEREVADTRIAN